MTYRLGVVPLLFNAGVASIDGGEIELQFAPTPEFLLDASLGYLDSGFDSITPPPPFGPVTPTATATLDSRLPFTPEMQGHLGLAYTFGSTWGLTPRVDVSYTDEQFFDAGNSPEIAQDDAVTLVNASLAFKAERREVALRAERHEPDRRVVSGGGDVVADHRFRLCGDHLRAAAYLRADSHIGLLVRGTATTEGGRHESSRQTSSPGCCGCPRIGTAVSISQAAANPSLDDLATPVPPDRTRPLCPYPHYARYRGDGSIDDSASFVCASPRETALDGQDSTMAEIVSTPSATGSMGGRCYYRRRNSLCSAQFPVISCAAVLRTARFSAPVICRPTSRRATACCSPSWARPMRGRSMVSAARIR